MRKLEQIGFGAVVDRDPLPNDPRVSEAFHLWRWLGGWHPERLPVYAAIHGLSDWELMTDLLLKIREHFDGR